MANFEIFPTLLGDRVHIFFPSGTHLDAPAHFSKGKWRVGIFIMTRISSLILLNLFFGAQSNLVQADQIPVTRLMGPGVKVDIAAKVSVRHFDIQNRDSQRGN